jgi:L-iditol 2-dehydrogenase
LHAQRLGRVSLGESVAVIGLGVSGQLHVQIAKAGGASQVIGISRSRFKNELAQQLGADVGIESGPSAVAQVLDETAGRGADVVIECTGVMASIADAIRMVRFGGRILLFGITSAKSGDLPFYDLYFKELTLINNRAATAQDFPVMIDLVDRGVVRLEPLVTHRMALDELATALGMVEDGAERRLKIILDHT